MIALLDNLGCRSLLFITLNISCHSLLACTVSVEKSADRLMGPFFWVTNCFSLVAFKILSLSVNFCILIMMCFGVVLFGFILFWTLHFLDLYVYFLHQIREVFCHFFKKGFQFPVLSLLSAPPWCKCWFAWSCPRGFLHYFHFFEFSFSFCCSDCLFYFLIFQIGDLILSFIYSSFDSFK